MKKRTTILIGLAAVVLLLGGGVGWWVAQSTATPFKLVLRGSRSTSDKLAISGGNLVVVAPQPGILFGTVTKPAGAEEFTYLVLFRYGLPRSDGSERGLRFQCGSDGQTAETSNTIELNGKRIEASYRIELDEERAAVASEKLTVGGQQRDPAAGLVFLIDLSEEAPIYHQKRVELPEISGALETPQDVERLAETIRASLARQDPEIAEFLGETR